MRCLPSGWCNVWRTNGILAISNANSRVLDVSASTMVGGAVTVGLAHYSTMAEVDQLVRAPRVAGLMPALPRKRWGGTPSRSAARGRAPTSGGFAARIAPGEARPSARSFRLPISRGQQRVSLGGLLNRQTRADHR